MLLGRGKSPTNRVPGWAVPAAHMGRETGTLARVQLPRARFHAAWVRRTLTLPKGGDKQIHGVPEPTRAGETDWEVSVPSR